MVMLVEEVQSKPAEIIKAAIRDSPTTKKPSRRMSAKVDKAAQDANQKMDDALKSAPYQGAMTVKSTRKRPTKENKAPKDASQKTEDGLKPAPYQGTTTGKSTRKRSAKGNKAPKDANQKTDNGLKLTPYQGAMKCFGLFHCDKCNKNWASPNSWADKYQKCKGCNGRIYPHTQFRLEEGEGPKRETPPHPQHLCQKCMQLGSFCGLYGKSSKQKRRWEREE